MKKLDKFEYIDDEEVFPALINGETVYAVVMECKGWTQDIHNLCDWNVACIRCLLKPEAQVIFLKEVKK